MSYTEAYSCSAEMMVRRAVKMPDVEREYILKLVLPEAANNETAIELLERRLTAALAYFERDACAAGILTTSHLLQVEDTLCVTSSDGFLKCPTIGRFVDKQGGL